MTVAAPLTVAETHVSVVVFLPGHALKLKKPIRTPFLDYSTLENRRQACADEVRLNRRLAPDVYLGVVDVGVPGTEPVEHGVLMRRMPDDRRLSLLARTGQPDVADHVRAVARTVAAFHERCERSPEIDEAGTSSWVRDLWVSNFDELTGYTTWLLDHTVLGLVEGLALGFIDGRGPLFERRIASGRIVDGHGDLLADDIFCLPDGPRILDCIEFSDHFRRGDVLLDVAMLAMDLERLGRPDLTRVLLDTYREFSNETHPRSLEHHYVAYRALVRAKIAAIRAEQGDQLAGAEAVRLLELSARHLERGRVRVVLVGGLPGTGKTTVADGLGDALGASVLGSDVVRKELARLDPDEHAPAPYGEGLYRPAAVDAVYAELLRRADVALGLGESVVLDASWTADRHRRLAVDLARARSAELTAMACTCPAEVAVERLRARSLTGVDASDATPQVAARMAAAADPWPDAVVVDTSGPLDEVLAGVVELVAPD